MKSNLIFIIKSCQHLKRSTEAAKERKPRVSSLARARALVKSNLGRMRTSSMRVTGTFPRDHWEQWEASVPVLGLLPATRTEGDSPRR